MIFGYPIKDILAVIGGIVVVFTFIKLLLEVIPKLNKIKSDVYGSASRRIKHKGLEKRAIASNIESVVNESVSSLQKELPSGWIRKARIKWVQGKSADELEDEELIIRIRPIENQDKNLMNGVFYYFSRALFPITKEVIPREPRKAAVLQLSRRTITINHPYLIKDFEKEYLEASIGVNPDIAYYLGHYNALDQRGLFTCVYLHEISRIAERIRYTAQRSQFASELKDVVDQIKAFIDNVPDIPEELWYRRTDISSYALLLVAKPAFWRKVDTYVNRARTHINSGITRLYVLGADKEKSFVRRVIRAIGKETEYTQVEGFEAHKDYRGESGGICAVYELGD